MTPRSRLLGALLLAAVTACGGTGDAGTPALPGRGSPTATSSRRSIEELARTPLTKRAGGYPAYAVTATTASVPVYDRPAGSVARRLAHPQPSGAPLTFLLRTDRTPWLEVYLPVRPNGSTGWVRADDVTVRGVPYRVDVYRRQHVLVLYERNREKGRYPVAIGTRDTPTPGGTFYLKELIRPTNRDGFYGPYAYGLSGFSTVYTSFGKGEGVIGLHGTSDERTIGHDVSHGCIRMRNADITTLAGLLPLGTPVRILS